jgi:hypothetical protein
MVLSVLCVLNCKKLLIPERMHLLHEVESKEKADNPGRTPKLSVYGSRVCKLKEVG